MEITLYRDSTGNWWDIKDILVLIGFPASPAEEVVAYVRKVSPGSSVSVDGDSWIDNTDYDMGPNGEVYGFPR
jgi:hypothetical protein